MLCDYLRNLFLIVFRTECTLALLQKSTLHHPFDEYIFVHDLKNYDA